MNRELLLMSEFWRCPNDGRVLLASLGHDDKVLCGCGKPQPATLGGPHHSRFTEPRGAHVKKFLKRATSAEYVRQEESDG
jgi:hypothetical protein